METSATELMTSLGNHLSNASRTFHGDFGNHLGVLLVTNHVKLFYVNISLGCRIGYSML